MKELDRLREEVRGIDSEIISLIAKRIEVTKKIGQKKKEEGMALRNWEIEKMAIDNAEKVARDLGLSSHLIRPIMRQLILESRIQQELQHYSAYTGDKENILIIGGLGEMGKWFSYFFQNQGHNVSIYDIKGESDEFRSYTTLAEGVKEASFVLIATTLDEVPLVIDSVVELNFKNVVFDVASLKGHLKDSIESARERGVAIASIHPMFGPNARTLADKVICLCDCGVSEANKKIEDLFRDTAASIVKISLDEHDRVISYVLGLSHLINVIFIKSLMHGGYTYNELKNFGSTTFFSQITTAESVLKENPYLYYAIQRLNPFQKDLYDNLKKASDLITKNVMQGNGKEFISIMEKGKQWLEGQ